MVLLPRLFSQELTCNAMIPFFTYHVFDMIIGNLLKRALHSKNTLRSLSKKMNKKVPESGNYVWIDLEMTGLEVEYHTILEAACIITTPQLKPVHEGLRLVIHQPEEVLMSMNSWSRVQHAKSGLTFECKESKISLTEADKILADYIKLHANLGGHKYLVGNSVHMDKRFLEKYMPLTDSLLHYRIVDVSSVRILCSHWYPDEYSKLRIKKKTHRALDDILESITELQDLQKAIFKNSDFINN